MSGSCEHWCHVYDGMVHAGTYSNGTMHTFTVNLDNEITCKGMTTDVPMSEARPWRDRKMLEIPVCIDCEIEVADITIEFEKAVVGGFFDDLEEDD